MIQNKRVYKVLVDDDYSVSVEASSYERAAEMAVYSWEFDCVDYKVASGEQTVTVEIEDKTFVVSGYFDRHYQATEV